jgi:hypothetical protein
MSKHSRRRSVECTSHPGRHDLPKENTALDRKEAAHQSHLCELADRDATLVDPRPPPAKSCETPMQASTSGFVAAFPSSSSAPDALRCHHRRSPLASELARAAPNIESEDPTMT